MRFRTFFSASPLLVALVVGALACSKSEGSTGPVNASAILDITNSSNASVWSVRIRDCGATSWSSDMLGADVIPPDLGQSFSVTPGCHDVKLQSNPTVSGQMIWRNVPFAPSQIVPLTVTAWSPE